EVDEQPRRRIVGAAHFGHCDPDPVLVAFGGHHDGRPRGRHIISGLATAGSARRVVAAVAGASRLIGARRTTNGKGSENGQCEDGLSHLNLVSSTMVYSTYTIVKRLFRTRSRGRRPRDRTRPRSGRCRPASCRRGESD